MKTTLFAAAMAAACTATLGGCATTATGGASDLATLVSEVQADASAVCKFVPTAATVASLVGLSDSALSTATEIASAICAAVVPAAALGEAHRRAALPEVDGIVVRGRFVR